ncbi:P27 family phage terminase small subunit [Arthrobacter sp. NyZ413]|uniref:P27 family phage terminase small subunit n=1 Tax=Arthrobacter sp. NyZ413 TaxID=3144669 RepID=UPI003BF89B6A
MEEIELDPAELEVLKEACKTLDEIDALKAAADELGPMIKGSTGQMVVNPALLEIRQARAAFERMVKAMALPSEEEDNRPASEGAISADARKAAQARWSRRGRPRG